jgi:hypothetical protein
MNGAWTQDVKDKEEKERFVKDVYTWINTAVGQKFLQIMERQLEATENGETKLATYESPSWAYRQAHLNGYRQHLLQVLALFDTETR